MIKRLTVLTVVLAMVGPVVAFAQTSDFAGTWQLERVIAPVSAPSRGASPGTRSTIARSGAAFNSGAISLSGRFGSILQFMRSQPADRLVITQSATELKVEEYWTPSIESGAYRRGVTYQFDGSEVTSSIRGSESTSKSSWEGGTLVTVATEVVQSRGRGSRTTETTETRSLSPDGQELSVETTVTSTGGFRGGGESTNTLVFKRQAS
jgi:hypothetical protein|tara:strand:- start:830 stop:1453 length:624 start_codon:yes stop_codon:yes gene_type:complete